MFTDEKEFTIEPIFYMKILRLATFAGKQPTNENPNIYTLNIPSVGFDIITTLINSNYEVITLDFSDSVLKNILLIAKEFSLNQVTKIYESFL